MFNIDFQDILWGTACLLLLGFVGLRFQRGLYELLLDRKGAAKDLIRRD